MHLRNYALTPSALLVGLMKPPYTWLVSSTTALPVPESDAVRHERVKVLSYALLNILASIYTDPKTVLHTIDGHIAHYGADSAFGILSNNPERFGELKTFCEDWFLPTANPAEIRSLACYALRFRLEAVANAHFTPPSRGVLSQD